jgi:hypothetical protein
MATVVFVHGTGVRQPGFNETFEVITDRVAALSPSTTVVPCYWAEQYGARLQCDGRSVPAYDQTKAVGGLVVENDVALWATLYEDPLAEMSALAAGDHPPERTAPGRVSASSAIVSALPALASSPAVTNAVESCAPIRFFQDAVGAFALQANLLKSAIQGARAMAKLGADGSDLGRIVVARAIVASTLSRAMAAGWPPCDAVARDWLVREIFVVLGGSEGEAKGMWGDLFRKATAPVVSAGARMVTWRMRSRRGAITDAVSPVSGDILVYLANGGPIRAFIRKTIEDATPPVHLLAHSLGGIACVDLCVLDRPPQVETLITVGSQSPYLYEIGALPSLKPMACLPDTFPRWINLHDPNDMLSYVGNGVFGGRVTDVEVRSGLPFPYSHSAYWSSDTLWNCMAERLR